MKHDAEPIDVGRVDVDEEYHLPAVIAQTFGTSLSEARRLIHQGGVMLNGRVVDKPDVRLALHGGSELQVGKRRTARLYVR